MRFTKELLEHMNACQEGYDWFNEEFPDGADYKEVLNAARYYDTINGDIGRAAFARMIAMNPKAQLLIEGTKVKEIYHVFNPLTGQHTSCNTVEEARLTREQYMQDYLESQKGLFSVAQEIETTNGDTLWNSIDIDKM